MIRGCDDGDDEDEDEKERAAVCWRREEEGEVIT
jgi:hypothetical protein